jgi:hypothetical protein
MSDNDIKSPALDSLNVEGVANKPICPVCHGYLESAASDYTYKRLNPDTRWFWCENCQGHLGYHRMKKRWKVDPYDLEDSQAFRNFFGVTGNE